MSDPHSFILNPNNVTKNLKRIPASQQSGWDADVSRLSQNVTMSKIKTLYKQDNHFNHFFASGRQNKCKHTCQFSNII